MIQISPITFQQSPLVLRCYFVFPRPPSSSRIPIAMASEGGFSCFQFLPTCPNIHQVIPFLIIYYLILKYANMTLKDFFFSLPPCSAYPVTFRQWKENEFWNHTELSSHFGFAICSLCDLNKLYDLSRLQLPHLNVGINNIYLAQLSRELYKLI